MECIGENLDGSPCQIAPMRDDDYCFFHSPDMEARRHAARQKGGRNHRRRVPRGFDGAWLETMADVADFVTRVTASMADGKLDLVSGEALTYAAWVTMQAMAARDGVPLPDGMIGLGYHCERWALKDLARLARRRGLEREAGRLVGVLLAVADSATGAARERNRKAIIGNGGSNGNRFAGRPDSKRVVDRSQSVGASGDSPVAAWRAEEERMRRLLGVPDSAALRKTRTGNRGATSFRP
ncbi:MAG: hypothetical protein HOP29_18910 [Phycisphaerales bacterium]|nr:hypothetical protein [Phycisphaerales bacterium]